MNSRLIYLILYITLCGLFLSACEPQISSSELSTLLKEEFQNRYIQPYVAGNPDEWMNVFTEEAVALHDGLPPLSGKAAIHGFATTVAENFSIVRLDADIDEVRREGNWAWTRGHFDALFEAKTVSAPPGVAGENAVGVQQERAGKFLLIWERQVDGRWLVMLDMGNSTRTVSEPNASLYFSCQACHREQGLGNEAMEAPAIAGMDPEYLARQMRNYRDGLRGHRLNDLIGRQMSLIATIWEEDRQIDELAAYIASMERKKPLATLPPPVGDAEALYAPCKGCHGSQAEGLKIEGLAMAWLDDWYIKRQLKNFRDGIRGYDERDVPGLQMGAAASELTDLEIDKLASFIATLPGQAAGSHRADP